MEREGESAEQAPLPHEPVLNDRITQPQSKLTYSIQSHGQENVRKKGICVLVGFDVQK
jgi:hypothetical protein